jgi:micrococcal nuclease
VIPLVVALTVCQPVPEPSMHEDPPRLHAVYSATFVSCYDGDTCTFNVHLGLSVVLARQTVRLYGIDTPELRGATREAAREARDYVIGVLQTSHQIELHVPQRRNCDELGGCDLRGKYGRLLANVVADGQSVNALLLATGRARIY